MPDHTHEPALPDEPVREQVPAGLRATAAWAWRLLLIGLLGYAVLQVGLRLRSLVLTMLVALLLTALLRPAAEWLVRRGLPRLAATWLVLLGLIAAAAAVLVLIQQRASTQIPLLRRNLAGGLQSIRDVIVSRFGIPAERVDSVIDGLIAQVLGQSTSGPAGQGPVVTGATTALAVLAALALALFTAFWLVYDGARAWRFFVGLSPQRHRHVVDEAGQHAWRTLGGYLRGVTIIALIDAVGIGLALVLIGVPVPFALALLTFVGGYVPIVGATVAGLAAVLVALAANGPTDALLTLAAVILVQQVEGQILQPIIMGRSVDCTPSRSPGPLRSAVCSTVWPAPSSPYRSRRPPVPSAPIWRDGATSNRPRHRGGGAGDEQPVRSRPVTRRRGRRLQRRRQRRTRERR